jgi:hypothetical protein
MSSVRCKFYCRSVKKVLGTVWESGASRSAILYDYEFSAVTSGSGENKTFFAATPSGALTFSSVNGEWFKPGDEVYIDIAIVGTPTLEAPATR